MTSDPVTEVERQIEILLWPSGGAGAGLARREALTFLLEHADLAHPRLLALASQSDPPVLALLALPEFGQAESVPVLERALCTAPDPTTAVAAQALALHPMNAARKALERGLGNTRDQVIASAADGLAERGERASCEALSSALGHENADVRARLRKAMRVLGCV